MFTLFCSWKESKLDAPVIALLVGILSSPSRKIFLHKHGRPIGRWFLGLAVGPIRASLRSMISVSDFRSCPKIKKELSIATIIGRAILAVVVTLVETLQNWPRGETFASYSQDVGWREDVSGTMDQGAHRYPIMSGTGRRDRYKPCVYCSHCYACRGLRERCAFNSD